MKKTEGKASSAALRRARAHDLCVLLKNNAVLLVALAAAGIRIRGVFRSRHALVPFLHALGGRRF